MGFLYSVVRPRMLSGIKIIEEIEGTGAQVEKCDSVVFDCAATLSKGTRVHGRQSESTVLGARRLIAGIEGALLGMREGGYRKVRISPHLAYRSEGVKDKVPPNAVLVYELWLKEVEKHSLTNKVRSCEATI